jgi:hypothetical protein
MVVTSWLVGWLGGMRLLFFFSAESGATMVLYFMVIIEEGRPPPQCTLVPFSISIRLMTSRRRRRDCLYLFSLPLHRPACLSGEYRERETTVVSCSLHPKDGWANGDLAAQDKSADFATHFTTTAIINRQTVCVVEDLYNSIPLVVVFIHHEQKKSAQWKLSRKRKWRGAAAAVKN